MEELIPPFDPEVEIRSIKRFPSSINIQSLAFSLSMFFSSFQRGLATEEQLSRYVRLLTGKYLIPMETAFELIEETRGFDFNQNPVLIVDEIDRSIWCGWFSPLITQGLLPASEIKRVTSQSWWSETMESIFEWYLSEADKDDDL